jgi:hypothetical protein
MIKDYIIIDNILDNPQKVIDLSRNISYYSKEDQGLEGITIKPMREHEAFSRSFWRGYRSDFLHEIDDAIFKKTFEQIVKKMLSAFQMPLMYHYKVSSHLHFAPASIEYTDRWWHRDPGCLFAGVIYLTENPEPDSGTILKLNGDELILENVFNRLVLYRSGIEHRPQKCFGDNINNCRFTITMFFEEFAIKA